MSETEHTKLPWLAGTRIRIHGDGWSWVDFGYLAAGTPERVAEAKANAAFIERAVNSHDALVAALTEAATALDYAIRGAGTEETAKLSATQAKARAALRLAEPSP